MLGTVDGTADVSTGNGKVRVGVVTGPANIKTTNGSVPVDRALTDITAWLELNTEVGRVYNELASSGAPAADETVDKVEVRASTKLGDVTIRRAPRLDEEAST